MTTNIKKTKIRDVVSTADFSDFLLILLILMILLILLIVATPPLSIIFDILKAQNIAYMLYFERVIFDNLAPSAF